MPDALVRISAILLALVFGLAAGGKLLRRREWKASLDAYDFPGAIEVPAAIAIPLAEIGVVALILAGKTGAGAAAALFLLACFSLTLLYARARRGDRLPCGCFGDMRLMDARTMLARNGALGLLCGVTLAGGEVSVFEGMAAPTSDEILPALLISAGFVLALWTISVAFTHLRDRR